ncbi:MAG: hypothetical protein NTW04_04935 [Elusimicrobia bacterium]|nr:hypothetical protein [Elusimicrobiota bacterium]
MYKLWVWNVGISIVVKEFYQSMLPRRTKMKTKLKLIAKAVPSFLR